MYYVYVYLDTRKMGNFVYNDLKFEYEPFYIGKGKNNRDVIHLEKCKNCKSGTYPFYDKLNKILYEGFQPIIIRLENFTNEEESLIKEKMFISLIGRKTENKGPLMNLTNGGIGGDTFSGHTENRKLEIRQKMSDSNKGKNKGKKCSDVQREFLRNLYKGTKNPDHSKKMKELYSDPDYRKKVGECTGYGRLKDKTVWDKKIIQYDIDGNTIKIWENYRTLKGYFDSNTIIKICNRGHGISKNFKWKWE